MSAQHAGTQACRHANIHSRKRTEHSPTPRPVSDAGQVNARTAHNPEVEPRRRAPAIGLQGARGAGNGGVAEMGQASQGLGGEGGESPRAVQPRGIRCPCPRPSHARAQALATVQVCPFAAVPGLRASLSHPTATGQCKRAALAPPGLCRSWCRDWASARRPLKSSDGPSWPVMARHGPWWPSLSLTSLSSICHSLQQDTHIARAAPGCTCAVAQRLGAATSQCRCFPGRGV